MYQKYTLYAVVLVVAVIVSFNNCSPLEGLNNNSSSGSNGSNTNNGGNTGGISVGQTYFNSTVSVVFRSTSPNRCLTCHGEPFQGGNGTGPSTIFSYASMRAKLVTGTQYQNALITKMLGASHGGGNVCPNGVNATPCAEVATWWARESGSTTNPPPTANLALYGSISYSNANGEIGGIAANPANTAQTVSLSFYVGGPKGQGTMVGSTMANIAIFDPNYPNKGFRFQLPAAYLNGRVQTVYAYGSTATVSEILMNNSSYMLAAYPVSANGRQTYFDAPGTVGATCTRCHQFPYSEGYDMLANPQRAFGGTATNNNLYKYAFNVGNVHSGGNICGQANSGVCATIQAWWNLEFGAFPP